MRWLVGLLAVIALGGCLASRAGAGAIAPARYDLGAYGSGDGGAGFHGAAGIYWASMSPNPNTPVDVGVGWMLEAGDTPHEAGSVAQVTTTTTQTPTNPGPGGVVKESVTTHGPYVELARR